MHWLDVNSLYEIAAPHFAGAMQSQVVQFGIAFSIAAYIHAGRVQIEIREQLVGVADSIKDLGRALRQDLASQSDRIGNVEKNMSQLNSRVENLETKKEH